MFFLPLLAVHRILKECNRITWSQSSSSIVPFMFLKNSVNWLPFFLSASDAATPAYISTAARYEKKTWMYNHNVLIPKAKLPWSTRFNRKSICNGYQEDWTHRSLGMLNQNSSPQESRQFYIFSCMATANKSLQVCPYISGALYAMIEKCTNVNLFYRNK